MELSKINKAHMTYEEMLEWTSMHFAKIIKLIENDAGRKCEATFINSTLTIKNGVGDIYIRFQESEKKIVIARVYFHNSRKGYLTELIELLKEYGLVNNFKTLEIESCNAQSANYVQKHNFSQRIFKNNYYIAITK